VADAVKAVPTGQDATTEYYVFSDQISTPRVIVRPGDNKMVWRRDGADPFGVAVPDKNPEGLGGFAFNLRFAGQYFDGESGRFYNWHRDYEPRVGRYTQSDPIGLRGGINTYGYVGENPLSYTDPLGLWRLPDYGTIGIPIIGPVGVSVTVDRNGNVYGGIGIGAGLRGGAGFGVGWTGDKCTPNSEQTQNFLGGWGYNAGVGIGVTSSGGGVPGSGPPESFGWNIQTPGIGVGYNWNLGNLGNLFK